MKKNEVKKNNKGFSLVELIVVIAIMAVLVGVLAPQFMKYVEKSREATDIQNAEQVASALKVYYADDESLSSNVSINITTTGITSGGAITDAGLGGLKLKSQKWDGNKITVVFDHTTGQTTTTGEAPHYYANGQKKSGS